MLYRLLFPLLIIGLFYSTASAQTFHSVGSGTDDRVNVLKTFDGMLAVGGVFKTINGSNTAHLALLERGSTFGSFLVSPKFKGRFDQSSVNNNHHSVHVSALEVFESQLHLGGRIYDKSTAGNINLGYLDLDNSDNYKFNKYFHSFEFYEYITYLKAFDGTLFAGGSFSAGGANNFARVDFENTPPRLRSAGILGGVIAMEPYNNELYVAGASWSESLVKRVGSIMQQVVPGFSGQIRAMVVYNNELIVGGDFSAIDSVQARNIARFDGKKWHPIGQGFTAPNWNGGVFTLQVYNNKLYAGGNFTHSGSVSLDGLAVWEDQRWRPLSSGSGVNGIVLCMEVYRNLLMIGGSFSSVNGQSHNNLVAYHDGSTVGINDELKKTNAEVIVFPNPFTQNLQVDLSTVSQPEQNYNIQIFDISGKCVLSNTYNSPLINLDLSEYSKGIYFLNIFSQQGLLVSRKKLIKTE